MAENDRARPKLERRGDHEVITGRNFQGEERSTDDHARAKRPASDESDEFVSDALEANSSPQDDPDE